MKTYLITSLILSIGLFILPLDSFAQCDFDVSASVQPAAADNIYCSYDSISFSTSAPFDAYQWYYNFSNSNQGGTAINGATQQTYQTTAGELGFAYFYVEATKDNCTEASSPILIDTWAFLSPVVVSYPQAQYCRGDSSMIAIGSGLWSEIQWFKENAPIPMATDSIFWVKDSGTYVVNASPTICPELQLSSGLGPSFTFEGPEIPTITQQSDTLLASSGPNYQWFLDGQSIPNATAGHYIPVASGLYTVQVSDGSGCVVLSNAFSFVLSSIVRSDRKAQWRVFPNPARMAITLGQLPASATDVHLLDVTGRILQQIPAAGATEMEVNLSDLSPGVYYLKLWQDGKFSYRRFLKN